MPDATDRYGYGGNPDLVPERSFNLEAGIRHRISGAQAVSLSWFRNEIDDLIVWVPDPVDPFAGQLENVDLARIEGVEAAWEYASGPWQARIEAIHQDPRNLTTGERLLRRAETASPSRSREASAAWTSALDLLATGDRKDFGYPEPVTLSSYVLAEPDGALARDPSLDRGRAARERIERAVRARRHFQHPGPRPVRLGELLDGRTAASRPA